MGLKHTPFIARTVLVNENVEASLRFLNKVLGREDIIDQFRRTRRYEKPSQMRRRINFERCKALYNEDMSRKITFLCRKDRKEPFPGCF